MSEWKEYKLGDAPLEFIDGDRGKNYPPQEEFTSEGYCLFLSTKNVRFNGFDFSDCQFISKKRDELLRKGKLNRYDLVLTTRGTIGNIGFYDDKAAFDVIRINSGMLIIRPDIRYLSPSFNYYIFRYLQREFLTFTSGSAQPQLPIRDLKEIEIKLPPLKDQFLIADVLSSLDDKIDLLHRQNKTLEAMAETLFRQWFVEEAEESWEVGKLADVLSVKGGTTPSTAVPEFWDGSMNWTTPKDLSNHQGIYMFRTERKITELGLSKIGSGQLPIGTVLLSPELQSVT
jgi:type I restriction enzyme S subunit